MGTFIWRSLAIVPFHLFFLILFTCNLSATSTQLTSSTLHDSLGLDVCKLVYCGKGTCNVAPNALFGFRCDCDSGWKKLQIHLPPILGNDTIEFPPCIIPNFPPFALMGDQLYSQRYVEGLKNPLSSRPGAQDLTSGRTRDTRPGAQNLKPRRTDWCILA
ncbi:hypothetical protein RIF29_28712 [Crotalaria pallida]|uniref:Uncharacterized protein n=1 Tax=Crotalaria pallida TaxID=3830 RepID=A0AAN9EFB8_CROPI